MYTVFTICVDTYTKNYLAMFVSVCTFCYSTTLGRSLESISFIVSSGTFELISESSHVTHRFIKLTPTEVTTAREGLSALL